MSTLKKFMGLTFLAVILALLLRRAAAVKIVAGALGSTYATVVGSLAKL